MSCQNLAGKRVLITHADAFMGPVLCQVFAEHGATVIADSGSLLTPDSTSAAGASGVSSDPLSATFWSPIWRLPHLQRRRPRFPRPNGHRSSAPWSIRYRASFVPSCHR